MRCVWTTILMAKSTCYSCKNARNRCKPFKCSQCGECFAEAATLVTHVKTHPKEKKHDCNICGELFSFVRDLNKHQSEHALDETLNADPDQEPTNENSDLLSQSLQQSGLKPFGCPVCGKSFNRNEYLIQHMRMHTGEKPHVCGVCSEKFTWHTQLAFHAKQHPGGKVFKCQQCDLSFIESSELAKHVRIHPRKKLEITEDDIAKAIAREKNTEVIMVEQETSPAVEGADGEEAELEEEVDREDSEFLNDKYKPYGCDLCGKFFSRKLQLRSHQRTHTGEKPHPCGLCEKSFSWSNQLALHVKMLHPDGNAFKCTTCDDCFSTARELCLHSKIHKAAHECSPCGLYFPNLKDFVKHTKQVHTVGAEPKKRGRKPKEKSSMKEFQCDFCGLCFARRDNLKEHLRVHTGAKPFQCDICGKFFRLMGHLVKHKRTHTGEKPYRCESCFKCFTDSSKLARHVQMHTGSRPFICRTCYGYFSSKELLAEHSRSHAGERKIRKPYIKHGLICETCGKEYDGSNESLKCSACSQITYECGICGDLFNDSNDLLEHTKLHSGDWAYQYISPGNELATPTIIQTSNLEFATRQPGGNLVIDVPAGATQEVIECILSGSDIVMQDQSTGGQENVQGSREINVVSQTGQVTPIEIQNMPRAVTQSLQHVNPNDMIQHETAQTVVKHEGAVVETEQTAHDETKQSNSNSPVKKVLSRPEELASTSNAPLPTIEEEPAYPDDLGDEEDDFFADLDNQSDGKAKPFECPDCGKKFRKENWMIRHRHLHIKPDDEAEEEEAEPEENAESEPDGPVEMDESDEDFILDDKPKKRGRGRPRKSENSGVKSSPKRKVAKKKKNGYECTTCGKCFASAKWLAKHKDTPHTCARCDKVFMKAKNLKDHMRVHTQEAKYRCPLCQEPQTKFVSLIKHCQTHDDGNYRCPSCNKLFTRLENMVKHTRYHNQGVQHTCDTCGKSFWQKWSLRQHQKVHSGEQPYQCETCGKCFSNIGNYKSHNRVHTGEKPYICESCGKAFREGGHLVKHRRTHTGEKPYVCGTCNACFTDSSKLARHKKTQHSNFGKGYKCDLCGKCFSRIDNLHTHQKTHTGEKTPRKSSSKVRPQIQTITSNMLSHEHYSHIDKMQTIEIEHQPESEAQTPGVEEIEQPVHTIEILRTTQEQGDARGDQQFLTLLVQRLNQDDPHNRTITLDPQQVRVVTEAHPTHGQVRTIQGYNVPSGHTIHPVHQVQRPNVLNQFANVVDDYAIHYASPFLHRK